jgi:tetratricopeptide (TPR) repeat protein
MTSLFLAAAWLIASPTDTVGEEPEPTKAESEARAVLDRVAEASKARSALAVEGRLTITYELTRDRQKTRREESSTLALAFARPNRFAFRSYGHTIACDGKKLVGVSMKGERYAEADPPAKLSLATLGEGPLKYGRITMGPPASVTCLLLCLTTEDDPTQALRTLTDGRLSLQPDRVIDGRTTRVVSLKCRSNRLVPAVIPVRDADLRIAIDRATELVARIDASFPAGPADEPAPRSLRAERIVAIAWERRSQRLETPSDKDFEVSPPLGFTKADTLEDFVKFIDVPASLLGPDPGGEESEKAIEEGKKLSEASKFDEAIAQFDRAIKLDPGNEAAYFRRALAYQKKGDHDRAIADYDRAIELSPEYVYALYDRGLAHSSKGNLDRSLADFDRVIALGPDRGDAYLCRGIVQARKGDRDKAVADFDRAIGLMPDDPAAYQGRATIYYGKGDLDRALADYDRVVKLDPANSLGYRNRALLHWAKGDLDRALADCDRAIAASPDTPDGYDYRARINHARGDHDRAIADLDKAILLNPKAHQLYLWRGTYYGEKGEYNRSIEDLDQALRLNSDDPDAYCGRGASHHLMGNYDQAIADYDEALRRKPGDVRALYNRGLAHQAKGEKADAIADYKKVLELATDSSSQERESAERALRELGDM